MPGLQKTLEGAGATKKDVVPRPEHEVFGLAMLGGGLVFGAAHPYGQFVEEVLRLSDAEVHADYPWDGLGEATVVDVGGGVGELSTASAYSMANLSMYFFSHAS